MSRLLPFLLCALPACVQALPCVDACEDDRDFWATCMAADGTLCDGGVEAECWDDPQALLDCEASGWESPDCDAATLRSAGLSHACATPDEAVSSCTNVVYARFQLLDASGKADLAEECADTDTDDAVQAAMDAVDCAAFCDALSGAAS